LSAATHKSGNLPDNNNLSWVKETQKMKKTKKVLALLLAFVMAIFVLASCATSGNVAENGTATIVIENGENNYTEYEVDLSKLEKRDEGALSLLEYIASLENSTLYYNATWGGGYGAYITQIGSLSPNPANQYIAVYTSEEKDFAVPSEWSPTVATVSYKSMTLTFSGVGLSSMNAKDGTVILFRVEGF
jgi:hypothetical protein